MLQLLHGQDESVFRNALQRLHVTWYHAATERLQFIFRGAGALAKACNLVPQVVQSCQACGHWKRLGHVNKFTFGFALACQEDVGFDLLCYRSALQFGFGGERYPVGSLNLLLYSVVSLHDAPIK